MRCWRVCAGTSAVLVVILFPATAAAQPLDAKSLIARGELDSARQLLEQQQKSGASSTEIDFLLGLIAVEQHAFRKAIAYFRAALVREPGSARLRLELGRAFYFAKDYRNASFQFERALAGDLPAPVQMNVRRFLEQIRRDRLWSYDVTLGIAPDTNINAGSSATETVLLGLPFELGSDARRKSGIGLVAQTSAQFAPRLTETLRWTTSIDARRRDYKGSSFDDTILGASSGPQWFGKGVELKAAVSALWRWYGGALYQRAAGGRVDATINSGMRTAFTLSASGQQFDYPGFRAQSGPVWSASAGVIRVFSPTTLALVQVSSARQKARVRDLSNRSALILANVTHDFRGGFTLSVTPSYVISNYDAPDAFFGVERRDRAKELTITILNRRVVVWRFTPTITYSMFRRSSTIDLYDSRQDRLELGFTSNF